VIFSDFEPHYVAASMLCAKCPASATGGQSKRRQWHNCSQFAGARGAAQHGEWVDPGCRIEQNGGFCPVMGI